ncbi:hypothetical protein F383_31947 [Gossypium arboreum]|uniref:Uncharacterized protein n=1 Tax=Gossypium arboreum TaxID=29729 RepID=A0A0B0MUZ8_GOSAR|nr:hypothetical protein F383_31947 [Gossypium arboreum]
MPRSPQNWPFSTLDLTWAR